MSNIIHEIDKDKKAKDNYAQYLKGQSLAREYYKEVLKNGDD